MDLEALHEYLVRAAERGVAWLATSRRPFCTGCYRDCPGGGVDFYSVNPAGGYGREEVMVCVDCLHKPEHEGLYRRLLECNVLEPRDMGVA